MQIDCAILYLINVQLAFTMFRVSQANAYHKETKFSNNSTVLKCSSQSHQKLSLEYNIRVNATLLYNRVEKNGDRDSVRRQLRELTVE